MFASSFRNIKVSPQSFFLKETGEVGCEITALAKDF
jgi:hypothetical protein